MTEPAETMRIDFSTVETKTFEPIPAGRYNVVVTDFKQGEASDRAKNPGAPTISWRLDVEDGDYEGRVVWENMTIVENSLWRLKSFLAACGFDVDGEIDFNPVEVIGSRMVAKVGIQRARKDPETGAEYDARNTVKSFSQLPEDDAPAP